MHTVSIRRLIRRAATVAAAAAAIAAAWTLSTTSHVSAISPTIVISQIYGGGGNAGATLTNDFIELYNRGTTPVSLNGWSVQYASAAGTTWAVTALGDKTLQPGQYFLVQEAQGAGGTTPLPAPDATGTISMSATAGKVALVSMTTALTGSCPVTAGTASLIDFVGFGASAPTPPNCFEGTGATPSPSNTTAVLRAADGATDTDNNPTDFTAGTPNPRNTQSNASKPPSGIGSSNPLAVNPGDHIVLLVNVTPGANPTSASLFVTANLSPFGASNQPFFDDGSNDDATPNDHIFSFGVTAPSTPGVYAVPFTVSDNLARSTNGTFSFTVQSPSGPQPIVISQIFGAGGNSGATWKNDFVELFNPSSSPISVSGWSIQYASAAGTTWLTTPLSGAIPPLHYYLVQLTEGSANVSPLPTPDAIGTVNMSASTGKVALVTTSTALTGSCPTSSSIVDFVGFGTSATCFEGAGPTSNTSATGAAKRKAGGCVDTNDNSTDFQIGTPVPRNSSVTGDCTITPAIPLAIHDIQGPGNTSPYASQLVTTTGVVTAVRTNGFFIQAPDSEVDTDTNTSEGVFVFTSSTPPAAAAPGNFVTVTGTVQEFRPDPAGGSATEIAGGPTVTLVQTGFTLPTATLLTVNDTNPAGGLDVLERFEGMRVRIDSLTVVAPTEGTVNEANATSTSNGVFFGVITGLPRPFREPGLEASAALPGGAPSNIPRFDENPERIRVDSDGLVGATALNVTTGATVTNLVGPLDYNSRTYTVLPEPGTATVTGVATAPTPVRATSPLEFTIGTANLERFFDTVNDPDISDVALTPTAFNNRLNKVSMQIRNVMRTPDVIGVEEVENLTTLQAIASKVNSDAVAAGAPNPDYIAYLVEGNDIGGIDDGFLVKQRSADGTVRVEVVDVIQFGKDTTYTNPSTGQPELLNDRPSLLMHAVVHETGAVPFPVTIIANHLRSLSGVDDPADGNRVRTKRRAQAEYLANYVQQLQSANPNERIVLVGDFNAFQFNDGYVDSIGTIKGTPTPADMVTLASPDLVNPDLVDLVEQAPADQRYSFVFDGNAQELDHVIVTQNVLPSVNGLEYGRTNADFPESFRGDATSPLRTSDHDPLVAFFALRRVITTATTVSSSVNPSVAGQAVTFTATIVGDDPTTPVNTGTVVFTDGSTVLGQAAVSGGQASSVVSSLAVGTHTVTASYSSAGEFASSSGSVTQTVVPEISIDDVTVREPAKNSVNAVFNVTLSAASPSTVDVNFTTMNQSATADSDYVATSGVLHFAPGVTVQTISVPVKADKMKEPLETFAVNLGGASNAAIADGQGIGTIIDRDAPFVASFSPASGPAGTIVTIIGSGFNDVLLVTFNGTPTLFTVVSPTTIKAVVPLLATSGPIAVKTVHGTSTSNTSFTVLPQIAALLPTITRVGGFVVVLGTGFDDVTDVRIGDVSASIELVTPVALLIKVAPGTVTGTVIVVTPAGTAASASPLTVVP